MGSITIRCGVVIARASAQPLSTVARAATHVAPAFGVRTPAASRSNSRMVLVPLLDTYTLDPSGVMTTSVGPLRVVSWRQSAVAENAVLIRELGQELHRRLNSFTGHLLRLGQRIDGAVDAYSAAVGSLERQVLSQARRFSELGDTADDPLPQLEPIDKVTRKPVKSLEGEGNG